MTSLKKFFTFFTLALSATLLLAACEYSVKDGQYAELAKCLTDKGVKFYGAWWCPHCAEQKKILGEDMRYITYVECDKNGKNANVQACRDAGVKGYPTWFFPGQGNVQDTLQPEELAAKANCPLPTDNTQNPSNQELNQAEPSTNTSGNNGTEQKNEESKDEQKQDNQTDKKTDATSDNAATKTEDKPANENKESTTPVTNNNPQTTQQPPQQ